MILSGFPLNRLCISLSLVVFGFSCRTNASDYGQADGLVKFSGLVGATVENKDGRSLGVLRDLMVDMRTGELRYAVVASRGFLGIRSSYRVVPARLLTTATAKRNIIAADVSEAVGRRAPSFKAHELESVLRPGGTLQIEQYFAASERTAPTAFSTRTAAKASGVHEHRSDLDPLTMIGSLVDKGVDIREREKIGDITDVLLEFGDCTPVFAIVSGNHLFRNRSDYVVPLHSLKQTDNRLLVDAGRSSFDLAPSFSGQAGAASTARIYRYEDR